MALDSAIEVLDPRSAEKWSTCTLGDYLRQRGYSGFFAEHYVVPMCATPRITHVAP